MDQRVMILATFVACLSELTVADHMSPPQAPITAAVALAEFPPLERAHGLELPHFATEALVNCTSWFILIILRMKHCVRVAFPGESPLGPIPRVGLYSGHTVCC